MADINEILKLTKSRSDKIKITRLPPSIATTDRPYHVDHSLTQKEEHINHNKTDNKPITKWQQTDNKLITNWQQTDNKNNNKNENWQQTGNTTDNKSGNKLITNWQQTDNKLITKNTFSSLVGLQREIVIFIYKECKAARSEITNPLTLEHISKSLSNKAGSIKVTIFRLEQKGFINRVEFKNGRGGWSRYSIQNLLFQQLLQLETDNKLITNWQQTDNKLDTQPVTQPITMSPSSSSSFNYLNTTTTSDTEKLNNEWLQIDIEPLSKIGFTKTHLEQLALQKILSPDVVQDSIYMFAFDLENTEKAKSFKKDAISFFMGILRKGSPYTPSENYEHPKSKAMRLYLECKRKEEQKRESMKQEIIDMAFSDWYNTLSDQEVLAMTPAAMKINSRESMIAKGNAKNHFVKNVLPTLEEVLEKCELQS